MCLTKHTHTASTVSAVPAVERSKSVARPEFARPGEGSALGICWFSGPPDCIRRLNALVDEKVAQFVEDAKRTGEPLPVEVTAVLSGDVVYKDRIIWVPLFYMFLAAVILAAHVPSHPLTIAAAAVVSFFWYDVFSGILHKSLDDPDFIALPVLREPCLEFQWHHHIPHDLASKPFLQVCGDLNLVMTVLFVAYVCPGVGFCYRSPTALCLVASKILMAYFGQLCHCMSHMPSTLRPAWVDWAQRHGLMISARAHLAHHKEFSDHFCIGSGLSNSAVSYVFSFYSNKWFWLVVFVLTLIVDVPVFNYVLCRFAGLQ